MQLKTWCIFFTMELRRGQLVWTSQSRHFFPDGNWQIRCGFSLPFQLHLFVPATDYTRPFAGQSDALQHLVLAVRALATKATPYM